MRLVRVVALGLLAPGLSAVAQQRSGPFVPVGVTYRMPSPIHREQAARDLAAVRAGGFNAIRTVVTWVDAEPERAAYNFSALEALLDLAAESDLKVMVQIDVNPPPDWVLRRYPDGRFVPSGTSAPPPPESRVCLDHPRLRDDVVAFVEEMTRRAAKYAAWYSVDVGSDLSPGLCACPHTQRTFRERGADRPAFVALRAAEIAKALADATFARGPRIVASHVMVPSVFHTLPLWRGQDDELMSRAVDVYGTSMLPTLVRGGSSLPPGSWLTGLEGINSASRDRGWWWIDDQEQVASRVSIWSAVSRGARGLVVAEWPDSGSGRVQEASAVARVITRNPALFAPLRPRPATVATTKTGVTPDVRVDGGVQIDARFLESADVLMLIALNHSDQPQRVTLHFTPDTQEAIWQNMETGASVNFVAGADGPTYRHAFAPRDALVLMIRKSIR